MPQTLLQKMLKLSKFFEDLQDLLELTLKKKKMKGIDVLFIIKYWNAKGGSLTFKY